MCKVLIIFLSFVTFLSELSGLEIAPFIHEFDPEKKEKNFQYYVTNKSDQPMAFTVGVFRRMQDENGNDILEKDDDSFTIFPQQIIVAPGSRSLVKVKWKGNAAFKENKSLEQAFRVRFDQYHIDTLGISGLKAPKTRGTSIKVSLRIDASLYMCPKGSVGNVKIISQNGPMVTVQNIGTRRVLIREMPVLINGKKLTDLLDNKDGVVLPGARRKFKIR
jgi:P pilus assembly chaperone PapD